MVGELSSEGCRRNALFAADSLRSSMHENFPQVWKQRKGSYVANTTSAFCQLCLFCQYQDLEEAKRKQCRELKSHQQEIEELSFVMQRWQRDLENVKNQVQWAAFTLENVPSFILGVGSQVLFSASLTFLLFSCKSMVSLP